MAKLLRKDVLKWIRNLKSGQYKKEKGSLVSIDGTKFCCLGVWADQHGCTWEEGLDWDDRVCLKPIHKNRNKVHLAQGFKLLHSNLAYGLTEDDQSQLATINDNSKGFSEVINYIERSILLRAK